MQLEGVAIPQPGLKELNDVLTPEELTRLLAVSSVQILRERATRNWGIYDRRAQWGGCGKALSIAGWQPSRTRTGSPSGCQLDLATLYKELISNYTLLAADLQDLPFRQRSIYNTIDYSWRLLPPELATLMAQFSTFHGIFSQQATAAITDALPPLDPTGASLALAHRRATPFSYP